jgi:hypothetical protein
MDVLPQDSALRVGVAAGPAGAGPSWSANVFEVELSLAVRVAVCDVLTADTLAVNEAEVAPDAMVTEEGTVTAVLLLPRVTANPPLGAPDDNVRVQASDPVVVMDEFAQVRPASVAVAGFVADAPLPCSLIVAAAVVEVPATRLSSAVESVLFFGLKCTLKLRTPPGARFTGRVPSPSTLNALSETVNCVI